MEPLLMAGAGAMDQRITLEHLVKSPDGAGGYRESWVEFDNDPQPWAHVMAKAGRESMTEGRIAAQFTVLFEIYNRCDVSETDRIVWQGTPYNIRGIRREGGRALRLIIEAERGVVQ
jgi:SPP1 family predicted phage head-tail adaptor